MDGQTASSFLESLLDERFQWKDPRHIATTCFRAGALSGFDPDWTAEMEGARALCQIRLREPLPFPEFHGILKVDAFGIWYYDGDGDVDESAWRATLLPWSNVLAVQLEMIS